MEIPRAVALTGSVPSAANPGARPLHRMGHKQTMVSLLLREQARQQQATQNISPRFAPLQLRSSERNHPRSCRLTPGFSAIGDTVLLNVSKTLQTQPNSAQKTSQMNALFQKILCSKATFLPKPPETPFSPAIIWVTANGYLFAQFGYHRVMRQHSADWVGSEGVSGLTQQQCLPADYTGRLNSSVVRYLRLENFNPEVQEPDPRQ